MTPVSADVIRRAQQGDADAFATLFHAHKLRVYSLCLRMTNNVTEAEDLAQDAFLQVFRKLASFRGDSALSTWLHRIAVNTVLMHFRRKSPVRVSLDEPGRNAEGQPVRREFGTRDGRLETSVNRLAITRAISELPAGYRMIFILHEVDGYEHREIAELLGCSVGNSKSQLHKAKLRMREILKSPNGEARSSETRSVGHSSAGRRKYRPAPVDRPLVESWKLPLPAPLNIAPMAPFAQSNA
jgi:RNA polymerase sigma-70 factor (ECF subfamily)